MEDIKKAAIKWHNQLNSEQFMEIVSRYFPEHENGKILTEEEIIAIYQKEHKII